MLLTQAWEKTMRDLTLDEMNMVSGGIGGREPEWAPGAMTRLFQNGVWAVFSSFNKRALQWKPVLTMTPDEADQVIAQVRTALG